MSEIDKRVTDCEECGRWGLTFGHHKVFKGMGGGRGYDFPANIIRLCHKCHRGKFGPHLNRDKDLQFKRQVKDYLWSTLTAPYYMPQDLIEILQLPEEQAYVVVKRLRPGKGGYVTRDIIYRLLGDKHDWGEPHVESGVCK